MPEAFDTRNEVSGSVIGNVVQAGTVTMTTNDPRPTAVMGLPPAVPALLGREEELGRLLGMVEPNDRAASAGGAVVVSGLAGVGKTALVLTTAHQASRRGWFPGGVLMIDMFGYDAAESRVRPEVALASLLENVGVVGEHIPADGPGRARLWRTMLAARAKAGDRMLIVIDNVSSSDQLRELRPGVPGHRVVATSRHTLADVEAAVLFRLGVLEPAAATELLRHQLVAADPGDPRMVAQHTEAERIAEMCGGLPLAIRIAGALLAADREQPLGEMAEALADEQVRLEELSYDGSFAVRSAFDLSYRQLDDETARLFRLLAVHPGSDFSTEMADAVLGGTSHSLAGLRRLHQANLIETGAVRGRWRMHDLVLLYARQRAADDPDRADVIRRITDYYLGLCRATDRRLPALGGDTNEMLRLIDPELPNIVAVVAQAHNAGLDRSVIGLAESLFTYFDLRKLWDFWVQIDELALSSASRVNDPHAVVRMRMNLGMALRDLGRYEDAARCYDLSLAYFQETGDDRRQAEALNNLAVVLRKRGEGDDALAALRKANELWIGLDDTLGQTRVLNNEGLVHLDSGDNATALGCFRQALELVSTTGDEQRKAKILHNLGVACQRSGQPAEAADRLRKALELREALGDRHREAKSSAVLGLVLLELGQRDEGTERLERAAAVFRELGDQRSLHKATAWLGARADPQTSRPWQRAVSDEGPAAPLGDI
ncbi:tetratricopeptide repeat protein [Lentzea sp. NPDC034063]|uniref:ATP-binding protein n=1 Tax=unclassified Lentzea TaxID=2643253 RepID=UPI0033E029C5